MGVQCATQNSCERQITPWVQGKENQNLVFIKQSMYWISALRFWFGEFDI